jgi:hypothetical protein
MRKRPFLLFVAATAFLFFPMELIFRIASGHEVTWIDHVLSGILPIFLLFGLIRVTKVGWYTLVATVSLWGVRDLYSYYELQSSSIPFLIHVGIYVFSMTYFINPRVRHVYFDPKLRWWRSKPRFETHVPFMMNHKSVWHYPILRNVSEGGCFIETPHLAKMSEEIQITIPLPVPLGVSVIKTKGEVRWISRNPLRYGMGVQFKDPLPEHAFAIKEFVRKQL